jgi:lipoprotein NlpI
MVYLNYVNSKLSKRLVDGQVTDEAYGQLRLEKVRYYDNLGIGKYDVSQPLEISVII